MAVLFALLAACCVTLTAGGKKLVFDISEHWTPTLARSSVIPLFWSLQNFLLSMHSIKGFVIGLFASAVIVCLNTTIFFSYKLSVFFGFLVLRRSVKNTLFLMSILQPTLVVRIVGYRTKVHVTISTTRSRSPGRMPT